MPGLKKPGLKKGGIKKKTGTVSKNSKLSKLATQANKAKPEKEEFELDEEGNPKLDDDGNPIKKKRTGRTTRTGLSAEQKKELDQQVADQAKRVKKKILYVNLVLLAGGIAFVIWWKITKG